MSEKDFTKAVKEVIDKKGLKQAYVAKEVLGISPQSISGKLRGHVGWTTSEVLLLCNRYGIDPTIILK